MIWYNFHIMKRTTGLILAALGAAFCGCAVPRFVPGPDVPRNATLKTLGGPLVQAHRGSRGEFDDNAVTLVPGEKRVFTFEPADKATTPEAFKAAFTVTHLAEICK